MELKRLSIGKSRNNSAARSTSIKHITPILSINKITTAFNVENKPNDNTLLQITALKKEKIQIIKLLKEGEILMDQRKQKYAMERDTIKRVFHDLLPAIDKHITSAQKSQIIEFLQNIQKSNTAGNCSKEVQCSLTKFDEDNMSTLCTNRDIIQSEISKYRLQYSSCENRIKCNEYKLEQNDRTLDKLQKELQMYQKHFRNEEALHKTRIPRFFFSLK